jgi:hypothetical protein
MMLKTIYAVGPALIFCAGCSGIKNMNPTILYNKALKESDPLKFEAIWFQMQDNRSPEMIPYMIKAMQDGKFKEEKCFDPVDAFFWLRDNVPVVYGFDSKLFMEDSEYRRGIAQLYQEWYSNISDKSLLKYNKERELFLTGEETRLELDILVRWSRGKDEFSNMDTKDAVVAKMSRPFPVDEIWLERRFRPIINYRQYMKSNAYSQISDISKYHSIIPLIYDFNEESLFQNEEYRSNIESLYQRWYFDHEETITYNEDLQLFLTGKETDKEISDYLEWRKNIPHREVIQLNYAMSLKGYVEGSFLYFFKKVPIIIDGFNLNEYYKSSKYWNAFKSKYLPVLQLWYSNNKGTITYNKDLKLYLTGKESEEEINEYLKWRDRYIGFVRDL